MLIPPSLFSPSHTPQTIRNLTMGSNYSLNCASRTGADQLVPARPVPARPVLAVAQVQNVEQIIQPKEFHLNNPRVGLPLLNNPRVLPRPPNEQPLNDMRNPLRPDAEGKAAPPRNEALIEISDEEDYDDDIVSMPDLPEDNGDPQHQMSLVQRNNSQHPIAAHVNGDAPQREGSSVSGGDYADLVLEDGDELNVNDPELFRLMMEGFNHDRAGASQPVAQPGPADQGSGLELDVVIETRIQCIDQILTVFPGICRDYVSELYDTISQSSDGMIAHILDKVDKGAPYPKAKDTKKTLKRKRELNEDEEAARKYGGADRVITAGTLQAFIRTVLSLEFPETPMTFITNTLEPSGYRLFSAYRVLEEANRTFDPRHPPYNKIKKQRKPAEYYREPNLEMHIRGLQSNPYQDEQEVEVLRELQAARKVRKNADDKREAEHQVEIEEESNYLKAQAEGTMSECGCCVDEFPLNRMVHCNNEEVMHWFCRGCAKQNAETEVGNSKYQLRCMSMDACSAGFSLDQRTQFLDENMTIALERNEQEAVLRMAGIENLASCPFCPYAAEYPPIEVNREFRCQAPDCEKVSCRLCKLESHIPKSCEENAKEAGFSIRRQIEEAMSAALIRRCNKCGTPFVKEEGCNKMMCTRSGCHNVQCYVCSKSCDYDHFNDTRRGGKVGNCPLFESVEQRHEEEVKRAEKEALDKVRAEHPEYTEEDLKVKMSENVLKDDEQRKANNPRGRNFPIQAGGANEPLRNFPDNLRRRPRINAPPAPAEARAIPVVHGLPPVHPRRDPQPAGFQDDIFRNVYYDEDIFAGLWDNLPGMEVGQLPLPQFQALPFLPNHGPQPVAQPALAEGPLPLFQFPHFMAAEPGVVGGAVQGPGFVGAGPMPQIPQIPQAPQIPRMHRASANALPPLPAPPSIHISHNELQQRLGRLQEVQKNLLQHLDHIQDGEQNLQQLRGSVDANPKPAENSVNNTPQLAPGKDQGAFEQFRQRLRQRVHMQEEERLNRGQEVRLDGGIKGRENAVNALNGFGSDFQGIQDALGMVGNDPEPRPRPRPRPRHARSRRGG